MLVIGYVFIVGLCFGSFLLAMVDRMHTKRDWVAGRSECDFCKHMLGAVDMIPLLSWTMFGGKCRYCKKKLSISYPIVELSTGLVFILSYITVPRSTAIEWAQLILWLLAVVISMALLVFDIRWYLLPTKLIRPLWFAGALYAVLNIIHSNDSAGSMMIALALALILTGGLFYVLHIVSNGGWIGDGDVRFGWVMGLFLAKPELAWLSIFLASLFGLLHAAVMKLLTQKKKIRIIPFGPSLIVSLFVVFLYGETIISWYKSLLLI